MAGVSTASQGKFDEQLPNEKPGERTLAAKRRKFAPVSDSGAAEAHRTSAAVDAILRRTTTELVDADKAAGRVEADRRLQRHAEKKAQSREDSRPAKGRASSRGSGRGGSSSSSRGRGGTSAGRGGRSSGSGPGRPPGGGRGGKRGRK